MTTTLPDDILNGLPLPTRGRWQPQRAGITGLFHYDAQIFTFYQGRLLLRGNNGNGKSMALEVLLPFVLSADTDPSQLSTFGNRNRSMYTWLLGHDAASRHVTARGYVWVEFARIGPLGQPEYFTVGAGMEAVRAGEKVSGLWYFTSAARIGVDLHVGRPGAETPTRETLATQLQQLTEHGLPGDIRATKLHRAECNRVLFGLPQDSYQALLKALRQLRRPKLSDKLSQKALAEILRDALPSLDKSLVASIASGYERLDRHQANIKELQEVIASLRDLDAAYQRYARAHLWQRAQAITAGHTALDRADKKARAAAAERDRLAADVNTAKTKHEKLTRQREVMSGQLAGLRESPYYTEGRDLEPRREQAETLEDVARQSRKRAAGAADKAQEATRAATDAHARSEAQDAEAGRIHTLVQRGAQLFTLLHRIYDALHDQQRDSENGDHETNFSGTRRQLRQAVADLRQRLHVLTRIAGQATDADKAVEVSAESLEHARGVLVEADKRVTTASELIREARTEFIAAAHQWMTDCEQLTAAGIAWTDVEPARISKAWPAWRDNAHRTRNRQLTELTQRLSSATVTQAEKNVTRLHHDLRTLVEHARDIAATADGAHDAHGAAQDEWLQRVTSWVSSLTYLPTDGSTLPPTDQYDPPQWTTWAAAALNAHNTRISAAERDLQQRQRAHDRTTHQCEMKHQRLTQERNKTADDTTGAPPVPMTRLDSREGRTGAALYALIDFTHDVEPAKMPALEAAIFGSGLADAWLHPDGVLSSETGTPLADTQLEPATKPVGQALTAALRPDAEAAHAAGLSTATVTAVLAGIGLADTAREAPSDLAIGWDGTWRAGPLHGAYRQQEAILIGAARRERVRQARLAELDQQLTELADELHRLAETGRLLTAEADQLSTARENARTEAADLPPTNAVDHAKKQADDADRAAREALDRASSTQPEVHTALSQLHRERSDDLAAIAAAGPVPGIQQLPDAASDLTMPPDLENLEAYTLTSAAILDEINTLSDKAREGLRLAIELTEHEHAAFPQAITHLQEREQAGSQAEQAQKTARTQFSESSTKHQQKLTIKAERQAVLTGALAEAGLTDWGTRLDDLPPKIDSWMESAEDWLNALEAQRATTDAARRATDAAGTALAHAERESTQASEDEGRAATARQHYTSLASRIGTDYSSLMAQITELEAQATETDAELKTNQQTQLLTVAEHGAAEVRATGDADAFRKIAAELPSLSDNLWAAVSADLPRAAGWDLPPASDEDDQLQTAKAAAQHLQELAGADAARHYGPNHNDDLASDVYNMRHTAEANLGGRLTLIERPAADILIVEAVRDNATATLPATIAGLNTEVISLQVMLNTEESKLLEQFLTDSIRRQVTSHIEDARKQINAMSAVMQQHRTSAGYRFALNWIPTPGAEVNDNVLDLLAADFGVAPSAKERLRDFFAARIATIRATRTGQTWETLLQEMLDYRRWYQFQLHFAKGSSDFAELDNTQFDKLSGGEKSVALHLPLFAAAATHTVAATVRDTQDPEKPGCPRLILLDEVFAGVDEDMRGELFDLVTSLNMDLVATSEAESGMYAELDGIAIYHLIKSPGVPGILAARSIWTGSDSINLLDNDLDQDL